MATTVNPDGTVTEFKIGQDDEQESPVATVQAVSVTPTKTKPIKLNKDGTPRKQMGPKKKYTNERKVLSGYIDVGDWNTIVAEFGSPTNAVNKLVEQFKKLKGTV